MKLFGRTRPAKWGFGDAQVMHDKHMYRLALVANEHERPTILPHPPGFYENEIGKQTFSAGNPCIGKPFRNALWAWLNAWFSSHGFAEFDAESPVAIWNNALECRDNFTDLFGGDDWTNRRVLEFVECDWAAEALQTLYGSEQERELILLRAENNALHKRKPLRLSGWKKYLGNDDTSFREYLDVGDLLAYAAFVADLLSGPWFQTVLRNKRLGQIKSVDLGCAM